LQGSEYFGAFLFFAEVTGFCSEGDAGFVVDSLEVVDPVLGYVGEEFVGEAGVDED
jgi:hypothetical protein